MTEQNQNVQEIALMKKLWPMYTLIGFFSMAFSGIYILVVPLSSLFWPEDPFHALEMGILITSLLWGVSISGIIFSRIIDNYRINRMKILLMVAIMRGFCMIMLSFTVEGQGITTWWYFYAFTVLFSLFGGGNFPNVASIAHDIVPKSQRSRFFGIHSIFRMIFQLVGFIISGLFVELGFWRLFFLLTGLALILSGIGTFTKISEPKRGAQRQELRSALKDDSVEYEYQIDKEMMKKTMLSKTNLVALVEGIFTSVFLGSLTILVLPYIQTPPHN
ncbi:MAG: MFS transporter, partial [Candidatus Lokiarchaeota archaeon]|nr:MFS transporter [Candidatus Lokiarchaeota archaeon]MBD3342862.1 MFS transporter [Candidatus Lokiarchaeota archaeon]